MSVVLGVVRWGAGANTRLGCVEYICATCTFYIHFSIQGLNLGHAYHYEQEASLIYIALALEADQVIRCTLDTNSSVLVPTTAKT